MIAYFFRFVDFKGEPTGYTGLAVAANMTDMFWTIDEFGDPYSVEIKSATEGGVCFLETEDGDSVTRTEVETCEKNPLATDVIKWRRPTWEGVRQ